MLTLRTGRARRNTEGGEGSRREKTEDGRQGLRGRPQRAILDVEFLILDWMEAELIAQKRGGPYYAQSR